MFDLLTTDPAVALILRLLLALIFAGAVIHKITDPRAFRTAVDNYRMLPGLLVTPVSAGFIVVECALVIMLVVPATAVLGAQVACSLLLAYTGAITFNLLRGRTHIDCGCMGSAHTQRLTGWLLLRNLPLVLIALAAALPAHTRDLVTWDYATIVFAVMALGMLYITMNHLLVNGPKLQALLMRHD